MNQKAAPSYPTSSSPLWGSACRPEAGSVTVAVCTRNRAKQLGNALSSLRRLSCLSSLRVEFLIVDNASTDETAQVVEQWRETLSQSVRYVLEPQIGFAAARARAMSETRTEWLAFLDDDELADPDWLGELLQCAERRQALIVGGVVHLDLGASPPPLGPFARRLLGETPPGHSEQPYSRNFQPGAGNLLIHRSLFSLASAFTRGVSRYGPQSRGEDSRWLLAAGERGVEAWFTPRAVVTHQISASRLHPRALRCLSRQCGLSADLGHARWGWRLFWIAWARAYRFAMFGVPAWLLVHLWGSNARALDQDLYWLREWTRLWDECRWLCKGCLPPIVVRDKNVAPTWSDIEPPPVASQTNTGGS